MTTPALPAEDVYATRKKIEFVLHELAAFEKELGRPARILDFGCGNAAQLGQFVVGQGRQYLGVDMHEPSLNHARSICAFAEGVSFSETIPQGCEFDVLLVSEVLEHLDEPHDIMAQLMPLVAENGCVIGSIPNGWGLTEIEKFVIHKTGLYLFSRFCYRLVRKALGKPIQSLEAEAQGIPYNHESGHVQFYTKSAIYNVLQGAGLRVYAFQNGSLMGADLSGSTFLRGPMINWNTKIAKYLPNWASATWHFAARKDR